MNILISIFIFLCTFTCSSVYGSNNSDIFKSNNISYNIFKPGNQGMVNAVSASYDIETYIVWRKSGFGYWEYHDYYNVYNDFDYMVSRSKNKINGYYYFDIWFFSQSYYWDGYNIKYSSTNIKYIDVYINNKIITSNYNKLGITFNSKYSTNSLRFRSVNKYPSIFITWKQMSAK